MNKPVPTPPGPFIRKDLPKPDPKTQPTIYGPKPKRSPK